MSQLEYVFRQAIQTYAGHFNNHYGTIELTVQQGMKALQYCKEIYDIVCELYKDNPKGNAKVKQVMD